MAPGISVAPTTHVTYLTHEFDGQLERFFFMLQVRFRFAPPVSHPANRVLLAATKDMFVSWQMMSVRYFWYEDANLYKHI